MTRFPPDARLDSRRRRRPPGGRTGLLTAWCLASALAAPGAQEPSTPLKPLPVTRLVGAGSAADVSGIGPPSPPPSAAGQPVPQIPPLPPLPVTQLEERLRTEEIDAQTFSLRLAEPVPIRELLLLLVRNTPFSVVPDPDVEGTFLGELKNVTLRQALDLVLPPLGLDYAVQDHVIRVFRRQLETRIFDINYVITRRAGRRAVGAATVPTETGVSLLAGAGERLRVPGLTDRAAAREVIGGSYTEITGYEDADLFEELAAGVRTLVSPEGRFNLDRKAAILQVTDHGDRVDRIGLYLDAVQLRVHRQVQIQAQVLEIELREEFAAGVDWQAVLSHAGHSVTATQRLGPAEAGGLILRVRLGDFDALLRAFARQGRVNVLSSPRVVAMNNEPAVMRVGTQDVFFVTASQVDAVSGRVLQTIVMPQAITEGVVLSVTPQIGADGIVNMSITPSVTERVGEAVSRLGDVVPILSVRETDTLVRVPQGETIVIAGLMQDAMVSETVKVPVLGDLPVLGGLFRREERRKAKSDLIVLLTPIVLTPADIAAVTAGETERFEQTHGIPIRPK